MLIALVTILILGASSTGLLDYISDTQDLAVMVASAFPLSFARGHLDAFQNAIRECIHEAIDDATIGEFGLQQPAVPPDQLGVPFLLDLDQSATTSVAFRQ